jgi:hypothetical protein
MKIYVRINDPLFNNHQVGIRVVFISQKKVFKTVIDSSVIKNKLLGRIYRILDSCKGEWIRLFLEGMKHLTFQGRAHGQTGRQTISVGLQCLSIHIFILFLTLTPTDSSVTKYHTVSKQQLFPEIIPFSFP